MIAYVDGCSNALSMASINHCRVPTSRNRAPTVSPTCFVAWMNLYRVVETEEMILLAVPIDVSMVTGSIEVRQLVGCCGNTGAASFTNSLTGLLCSGVWSR